MEIIDLPNAFNSLSVVPVPSSLCNKPHHDLSAQDGTKTYLLSSPVNLMRQIRSYKQQILQQFGARCVHKLDQRAELRKSERERLLVRGQRI